MSQNPNSGPNNYNPYGPNPSNPNYPPNQGTAYGGSQPPSGPNQGYNQYPPSNPPSGPNQGYNQYPPSNPPSGPNQGYNQYPPSNPPSGPNPNVSGSNYGAYNPYEPPPPPPSTYNNPPSQAGGTNPYANPTPGPVTGPNQYDPYAQTMMSQNPNSAQPYTSYPPVGQTPMPGPMPQPEPPVRKSHTGRNVLIAIIALVIIVGGVIGGVVINNNNVQVMHANATATAQANTQATITAQERISATQTAIASVYPFSSNLVLNDPLTDNSKGVGWENDGKSCFFSGSAYHAVNNEVNTYLPCGAKSTDFTNFTYEVQMDIKKGATDSGGGLIFRADEDNAKYYRLLIDSDGGYALLVSVDTTGTGGNARDLKDGTASQFATGIGQTNTLSVVANGEQITFYVNRQMVASVSDSTYSHGQIGVTANDTSADTEVVYSNVKVWKL